jgi:hypothetical protein
MGKTVRRSDGDSPSQGLSPGEELLRELAGYPRRAVHLDKQRFESRIVYIQRNADGVVVGSEERLELSEFTELTGDWLD